MRATKNTLAHLSYGGTLQTRVGGGVRPPSSALTENYIRALVPVDTLQTQIGTLAGVKNHAALL